MNYFELLRAHQVIGAIPSGVESMPLALGSDGFWCDIVAESWRPAAGPFRLTIYHITYLMLPRGLRLPTSQRRWLRWVVIPAAAATLLIGRRGARRRRCTEHWAQGYQTVEL